MANNLKLAPVLALCVAVICSSLAQLCFRGFGLAISADPVFSTAGQLSNLTWLVSGLALYVVSLSAWFAVLGRYELSVAYPMLSLCYPLVLIGAVYCPFFNESLSVLKVSGIFLIVLGTWFISATAKPNTIPDVLTKST